MSRNFFISIIISLLFFACFRIYQHFSVNLVENQIFGINQDFDDIQNTTKNRDVSEVNIPYVNRDIAEVENPSVNQSAATAVNSITKTKITDEKEITDRYNTADEKQISSVNQIADDSDTKNTRKAITASVEDTTTPVEVNVTQFETTKDERFQIQGMISMHPYIKENYQIINLEGYYVKTVPYPRYYLGQFLSVETKTAPNFKSIFMPQIKVIDQKSNKFLITISKFREKIISNVEKNLSEPYSTLLLGITVGYKTETVNDLKQDLIDTGIIHVMVVSGYNVALLLTFLSFLFTRFGRFTYFGISFFTLIVFTIMVGFEPPIIRAFIMGSITVMANVSGRPKMSLYVLFLTACLMLIINPDLLVDLSFQLTFLASLGVITASSVKLPSKLKDISLAKEISILILVNLLVWPVISYYFERVVILGLITNLLISWMIPIQTILGFVFMIFPVLPIKIIIVGIWDYFILVVDFIKNYESFNISYKIDIPFMLVYYLLVFGLLYVIYVNKKESDL